MDDLLMAAEAASRADILPSHSERLSIASESDGWISMIDTEAMPSLHTSKSAL